MKENEPIEQWLLGLSNRERAELPEGTTQRVISLQRRFRKPLYWSFVIEILFIAALIGLHFLIGKYYPNVFDFLTQYLSQTRLSLIGAVLIVAVGCGLYVVRQKWRLTYGLFELAFATVYGFFALRKASVSKGYVETISVVAAVYLVVRGVENIAIGWKARQQWIKENRARLQKYIESGKE